MPTTDASVVVKWVVKQGFDEPGNLSSIPHHPV